jgi:hypothetical protein
MKYAIISHIETGGLSPTKHPILEVALIYQPVLPDGSPEADSLATSEFFLRIKCPEGLTVQPEAAALNGYSPEEWGLASTPEDARKLLTQKLLRWSVDEAPSQDVCFSPDFRNRFMLAQLPDALRLIPGPTLNVGKSLKAQGVQGRLSDLRVPGDGSGAIGACRAVRRLWAQLSGVTNGL